MKKQYFSSLGPKAKMKTKNSANLLNPSPLTSDKITVKEVTNLIGDGKILSTDIEITNENA